MESDVAPSAPPAGTVATTEAPEQTTAPNTGKPVRLWVPVTLVVLYWLGRFAFARMELPMVVRFGSAHVDDRALV